MIFLHLLQYLEFTDFSLTFLFFSSKKTDVLFCHLTKEKNDHKKSKSKKKK